MNSWVSWCHHSVLPCGLGSAVLRTHPRSPVTAGAEWAVLGLVQALSSFVFHRPLPDLWYFGVRQTVQQMTLFTWGLTASLEILFSRRKDAERGKIKLPKASPHFCVSGENTSPKLQCPLFVERCQVQCACSSLASTASLKML